MAPYFCARERRVYALLRRAHSAELLFTLKSPPNKGLI